MKHYKIGDYIIYKGSFPFGSLRNGEIYKFDGHDSFADLSSIINKIGTPKKIKFRKEYYDLFEFAFRIDNE